MHAGITLAAAVTKSDVAIWLGIYASIVATAAGLWALFTGIIRDRARITVHADDAYAVEGKRRRMIIRGDETLETLGIEPENRRPILVVAVRNRGRRSAHIDHVAQSQPLRAERADLLFHDFMDDVPFELQAESSHELYQGLRGGHEHGRNARRFFVVDGAGRTHPLRERYRQRLERPIRAALRRRRRRRRNVDG